MTALAAARTLENFATGRNVYDLQVTTQVWAGGLVGLNAGGFLIPWANVNTTVFIGVCLVSALEVVGVVDVAAVNDEGMIIKHVPIASAVQGSVGLECYSETDNVLTDLELDSGVTSRAIGRIIRFLSNTDCDIQLYSAQEWMARYIQTTT